MPKGAASTCSSQDFSSPQKSQTERKKKEKKSLVRQQEIGICCVCTNPNSTEHRDRRKVLCYLGAKGKPSPGRQLSCSYLISWEPAFRHRLQISQLHYPVQQCEPHWRRHTKHHLSSSILSRGRGKNVVPIYQFLLLFLFVLSLICPLGDTYKSEEQSRDGTLLLLAVFLCLPARCC